jgi:hypothetical protein
MFIGNHLLKQVINSLTSSSAASKLGATLSKSKAFRKGNVLFFGDAEK